MVYKGKFPGRTKLVVRGLDPHFEPGSKSPVARFRPDADGLAWAIDFAKRL